MTFAGVIIWREVIVWCLDMSPSIIIDKENKGELNSHNLKFGDYEIKNRKNVTLLGIDIDDRLKFDNHTHSLIRKASGQLNYLTSKQKFLNKNAKKILI